MKKKLAVLAAVLMASAVLGGCAQRCKDDSFEHRNTDADGNAD